ncbi:phosphoesterase superfamily protein [Serinicoccus hydrothermalis]|uniref:Phosphoesterase superfamily protein n=1 Tax=Serinicoccus hydrothermalis TaxID=1758689 RepID=A0A1B1NGD5_9MICO|nr:2'-5' RNA ligase family protein [Serinicoccus hydrothermalis]ANS80482.1 phosphoesterase superfamily protein [Serinicoccus hydrothermalis]
MSPSEHADERGQASLVVGVALPVPEPWGSHLQRLRIGYGEERAAAIPTHITLLPPTPITEDDLCSLEEHLECVAREQEAFEVMLRGTGTFRPVSEVVFVQVAKGVADCERLERAVRTGPVRRPLDFPYHPHVTIAHDLPLAALDRAFRDLGAFSCSYPADAFRLYVHDGDGEWRTRADYPLAG